MGISASMRNNIKKSHISEDCKYYTLYQGYLLTVCSFKYQPEQYWFLPYYLRNVKLLSIKDHYGNEYRTFSTLRVGHSISIDLKYYTTIDSAHMKLDHFVYSECNRLDISNKYQPIGRLFILRLYPNVVERHLIDSGKPGQFIADRIDGKWKFR